MQADERQLVKLIEALDSCIKAGKTPLDIEVFDLMCQGLLLKPTDRDVVEAFMYAGWRVKLEFSERSLVMNGWLTYDQNIDRRRMEGVAA